MANGVDERRGKGPAPGAPNAGRPPSAIRASMREALDERLKLLASFADDPNLAPLERMRALDMLAKYGIGTTQTATDTEGDNAPPGVVKVVYEMIDTAE